MYAKTEEILIIIVINLIVLYQYQFPGFGNILWLRKIYQWRESTQELYTIFATLCESKIISKERKRIKKKQFKKQGDITRNGGIRASKNPLFHKNSNTSKNCENQFFQNSINIKQATYNNPRNIFLMAESH